MAISTTPMSLPWTAYAGDRNRQAFALSDSDPVDLTGAVVEAQARASAISPEVALTGTITEIDFTLGAFSVEWDGEEIRALLAGQDKWQGVWDLQITEAGETLPLTVARGTFTALHDVTRA